MPHPSLAANRPTNSPLPRRSRRRRIAVVLALLLALPAVLNVAVASAQQGKKAELPLSAARTISFATTEGTYMNLDVSPDGSTIVFDLLGDLYTVPVAGGPAQRLTVGIAHDMQPVFSPDGSRIAFISDRSGSDNIWTIDLDGANAKAISKEKAHAVSTPEWAPEGGYVMARRGGELWLYHLRGGSGLQVTKSPQASGLTGPHFGPDGRHVYFSSRGATPGFALQGINRMNAWQIQRLDRKTGDVVALTASPNGAFRPRVSPDGARLVYGARVDAKTGLRVRDLASGRERWLAFDIDRDNSERPGALDLMPRFAFMPDSSAIVIATGGTFHRLDLASGADTPIAFSAQVDAELGPFVFFPSRHDDGPVVVRNLRYANRASDGDRLVFSALAKIWLAAAGEQPRQVVNQDVGQFQPVFSPDGTALAYVTWDDEQGGHVWRLPLDGVNAGPPVRLTEHPGFYLHPAWSSDGSKIAFVREDPAALRNIWSRNTGEIVWVPAAGGPLRSVTSAPSDNRLTFSADGDRISYVASARSASRDGERPAESEVVSVRLDGTDKHTIAKIKSEAWEAVPSPNGRWVAWSTREDIYVAALPMTPEIPQIGESSGPGPVKRISREGGIDIHWDGNDVVAWSFANEYQRISLDEAFAEPEPEEDEEAADGDVVAAGDDADGDDADTGDEPADDDAPAPQDEDAEQEDAEPEGPQPETTTIDLTVPRYRPEGTVALVGGTIISMASETVIDDGVVLVEGNRIRQVGGRDQVEIPDTAHVVDVAGKYLMPGLIDLHAHLRPPREVFVQSSWAYLANLAYGVTSARDVSTSNDSFAYAELVESGAMWGPRIYSTGRAMTTTNAKIESLDDARAMVRHYKKLGTDVIKQYMQPHRRQRQWVIMAAQDEGINVTNEGGGDLRLNITQVLDGYTGFEHSLPVANIYDDVVQLVARSNTWYTPTLVVSYGGPTAEWYFYQTTDVHDDPKLSRFTPHDDLDRRTRRGQMNALDEYHFQSVSRGAARILQAGGKVGLGAHGEQQGICAHWELWALQMGGLSNYDAIRTATSLAAEGLGRLDDLGTLEAGKLADILVLDANPLADIRNSKAIRYVIKNGELFDGNSLDRLWPHPVPRPAIGYRDIGRPPTNPR